MKFWKWGECANSYFSTFFCFQGLCKQTDWSTRQIERWWRRRRVQGKASELTRFKETSWRFIVYFFLFYYGLAVLWNVSLTLFYYVKWEINVFPEKEMWCNGELNPRYSAYAVDPLNHQTSTSLPVLIFSYDCFLYFFIFLTQDYFIVIFLAHMLYNKA